MISRILKSSASFCRVATIPVLTLVHSPPEKKFSFLNPDELAKMKEEEGKSALWTRGASDHSQGFEDKNLGSSPVCLGRGSYSNSPPAVGTLRSLIFKT